MIRLKPLIKESLNSSLNDKFDIDRKKAVELLSSKASVSWYKHLEEYRIFRGVPTQSTNPFKFVSPSKTYRKAKNTLNIVNSILDVIPSWKDWPKRSRSLIGSSKKGAAEWYGKVFQVFPLNGAKIGICSDFDFWQSFSKLDDRLGGDDIDDLNWKMQTLFKYMGVISSNDKEVSYGESKNNEPSDFLKFVSVLNKKTKEAGNTKFLLDVSQTFSKLNDIINDMMNQYNGNDWLEYFDNLFNPEENGFRLISIQEYSLLDNQRHEVWTDSDCLLMFPGVTKLLAPALKNT